jgi:ATP-dependent Clp protease ATP-binding subunit ClpA
MNRLDKVVVFQRLTDESMRKILDLELQAVQRRILKLHQGRFIMRYTDAARRLLLQTGTSAKYGARELKRTIERNVVLPLSNLVATRQINEGDVLLVDLAKDDSGLVFMKHHVQNIVPETFAYRFDSFAAVPAAARAAR